ncbi:MAG: hypothetical protein ACRECE_04825 [Xanthobacteraceae bacterium]
MQREAAGRIDVNAVTLKALGARAVAFIDREADALLLQALR